MKKKEKIINKMNQNFGNSFKINLCVYKKELISLLKFSLNLISLHPNLIFPPIKFCQIKQLKQEILHHHNINRQEVATFQRKHFII